MIKKAWNSTLPVRREKERTKKPMMQKEDSGQTLDYWRSRIRPIFNQMIRERDFAEHDGRCISCGIVVPEGKGHAGHYYRADKQGGALGLEFDERNVNLQCEACNIDLHGNLSGYATGFVERYGWDAFDRLKMDRNKVFKPTATYYEEIYEETKKRKKPADRGDGMRGVQSDGGDKIHESLSHEVHEVSTEDIPTRECGKIEGKKKRKGGE